MSFDPISNNLVGKMEKQHLLGTPAKRIGGRDNLDPHFLSGETKDVDLSSKLAAVLKHKDVYDERAWMVDKIPVTFTTTPSTNIINKITGTTAQLRDAKSGIWLVVTIQGNGMSILISTDGGLTWNSKYTNSTITSETSVVDVAMINGSWFVVTTNILLRSINPQTEPFTPVHTCEAPQYYTRIKYINSTYVLLSNQSKLYWSDDGINWVPGVFTSIDKQGHLYVLSDIEYDHIKQQYVIMFDLHAVNSFPIIPIAASHIDIAKMVATTHRKLYIICVDDIKTYTTSYTHIAIDDNTNDITGMAMRNPGLRLFKFNDIVVIVTYRGYILYECGTGITSEIKTISNDDSIMQIWKDGEYYVALSVVNINHFMANNNRLHLRVNISKDLNTWRPFEIYSTYRKLPRLQLLSVTDSPVLPMTIVMPEGNILNITFPESETYTSFQTIDHETEGMYPSLSCNIYTKASKGDLVLYGCGTISSLYSPDYNLLISEDGGKTFIPQYWSETIKAGIPKNTTLVATVVTALIVHDGIFYAALKSGNGEVGAGDVILCSENGKDWTYVLQNVDVLGQLSFNLDIIDGKLYASGLTSSTAIRIYEITRTNNVSSATLKSTVAVVTDANISTAPSKLIKFNDKFYFSFNGHIFGSTTLTDNFVSRTKVDTVSTKLKGYSCIGVFNNTLFITAGNNLFYLNGNTWLSIDLKLLSSMFLDPSISPDIGYSDIRNATILNTELILSSTTAFFCIKSFNIADILVYYTPYSILSPLYDDGNAITFGSTGFICKLFKTKQSAKKFFSNNWYLYGYEKISSSYNGRLQFSDSFGIQLPFETFTNNNIPINTANIPTAQYSAFDYMNVQDQIGSISTVEPDFICSPTDHTCYTVQLTDAYYLVDSVKFGDNAYTKLDPTKIVPNTFYLTPPITSGSEVFLFASSNTQKAFMIRYSVTSQTVSYYDISAWYIAQTAITNYRAFGFAYFAKNGWLFFENGLIARLPSIISPSTSNVEIYDIPAKFGTNFRTDVFIRNTELINDELWCIYRPLVGSKNDVLPNAANGVGSIIKITPQFKIELVRKMPQFWQVPVNPVNGGYQHQIIQSPSVRYSASFMGKFFTYGLNRDISYWDSERLKPIPNICKNIAHSDTSNALTDKYSVVRNSFISTNNLGTEIIAKTGSTWFKANKPQSAQQFMSVDITNSFKIPPLTHPTMTTMCIAKNQIVYVGIDGEIYILPITSEWESNVELAIQNTSPIKIGKNVAIIGNVTILPDFNNDVIAIVYTNPTTSTKHLIVIKNNLVLNEYTLPNAVNGFADLCIVNNDLIAVFSEGICKIIDFINSTGVSLVVDVTSAAVPFSSIQSGKYHRNLNKIIISATNKATLNTSLFSLDISTFNNILLCELPQVTQNWEIYTHGDWTYISGTSMFACAYRTKDFKYLYPIRLTAVQDSMVHNGSGMVNDKYLVSQSAFIGKISIVNINTWDIDEFVVDIGNGFSSFIRNSNNVIHCSSSGCVTLFTEKNMDTNISSFTNKVINTPQLIVSQMEKISRVGNLPFSYSILNNSETDTSVTLNGTHAYCFCNGVYFVFSRYNVFWYSLDLVNWMRVILGVEVDFSGGSATTLPRVIYRRDIGWVIQCNILFESKLYPGVLWGTNIEALNTRQISTTVAGTPYGLIGDGAGIYLNYGQEIYYIANILNPTQIVATGITTTDPNHVSKIGLVNFSAINFISPFLRGKAPSNNTTTQMFGVMHGHISVTPYQLHLVSKNNGVFTSYPICTLTSKTNQLPRLTYVLHDILYIIMGAWGDRTATTDNTRIIGIPMSSTSSVPVIKDIPAFDTTYRVISVAYSREVAVMCAQNSADIKATFDGQNWTTVATIPNAVLDMAMPVAVLYNDETDTFSVFISDGRIFNINPSNTQKIPFIIDGVNI